MSTTIPLLTDDTLILFDACRDGLENFRKHYPQGALFTSELLAAAPWNDMHWFINRMGCSLSTHLDYPLLCERLNTPTFVVKRQAQNSPSTVAGYVECMLGVSDNGEDKEFKGKTIDSLSPQAWETIAKDIVRFYRAMEKHDPLFMERLYEGHQDAWSRIGHNFWLQRNGHGTGFWDRDPVDVPDDLQGPLKEVCSMAGECDAYVGDDGLIYLTEGSTKWRTL